MKSRELLFNAYIPSLGIILEHVNYNYDMIGLDYDAMKERLDEKFSVDDDGEVFAKDNHPINDDYKGDGIPLLTMLCGDDYYYIEDKKFLLLLSIGSLYPGTTQYIFEGDEVKIGPDKYKNGVIVWNNLNARYMIARASGEMESLNSEVISRLSFVESVYNNPNKQKYYEKILPGF